MHDREWAELGKIDYLLDELARAVERGEVHRDSYDILAPRYLARREAIISTVTRQPAAGPAATPPTPGTAAVSSIPATADAPANPPVRTYATAPKAARKPFNWTTALIITGAFLVINAAALFVLAAWDVFGPVFQIAFHGVMTAAFYAAGIYVRSKLAQSVGGVALVVVGSAMLLFDGWLLIDVIGLSGPWPWAAWLLLCSGVYWFTETRLEGGFFGVVGAGAQVAWWWLLGEGLGWDPLPRLAALGIVAALWTLAARSGREVTGLSSMARVLRVAGPVLMALVLLASFLEASMTTLSEEIAVLSALVIAWSAVAVAESAGQRTAIGVLGHAPLLLLALAVPMTDARWLPAALLALAALAAVGYELVRGYGLYGTAAGLLAASAAVTGARAAEASAEWQVVLVAAIGAVFVAAGGRMRASRSADEADRPPLRAARSFLAGGLLVLAGTTLLMLPALGVLPLSGWGFSTSDALAIGGVFLMWLLAAGVGRSGIAAAGAILTSVLALAGALDLANVSWEPSLLAVPFLALAFAWVLLRDPLERWTRLPAHYTLTVARAFTALPVLVGLLAEEYSGTFPHWGSAILFAAAALWWFADRAVTGERWAMAPAAALTVAAAGVGGFWAADIETGAIAAAAIALAGATLWALLRSVPAFDEIGLWSFSAAGLAAVPFVLAEAGPLALTAMLAAAAVAVASVGSRRWWPLSGAVALATLAALGALAHFDASASVSVVALALLAWACLLPLLLPRPEDNSPGAGVAAALAAGGAAPWLAVCSLGAASGAVTLEPWAHLYGHPLVFGLVAFGAWLLVLAVRYNAEPVFYAGVGLMLVALFVELDVLNAKWVELYSTPAALYVAWVGYRWASRDADRQVPLVADAAASFIALGIPFLAMLEPGIPAIDSWVHTFAVFGIALVGIALGVVLRVRTYFFAGIAAVVVTALARTWDLLLMVWWLVLGVVGTAMIVVALARELRVAMASGVRDLLLGWR